MKIWSKTSEYMADGSIVETPWHEVEATPDEEARSQRMAAWLATVPQSIRDKWKVPKP